MRVCLIAVATLSAGAAGANPPIYKCVPIPPDPALVMPDQYSFWKRYEGVYMYHTSQLSWELKNGSVSNATGGVSAGAVGLIMHDGWDECDIAGSGWGRLACSQIDTDSGPALSGSLSQCLSSDAMVFEQLPECVPDICNTSYFPRASAVTVCPTTASVMTGSAVRMGVVKQMKDILIFDSVNNEWDFYDEVHVAAMDLDAFYATADYSWSGTVSGGQQSPPYFAVDWSYTGLATTYGCGSTERTTFGLMAGYANVCFAGSDFTLTYTSTAGTSTLRGIVASRQLSDGTFETKRLGVAAGGTVSQQGDIVTVSGTTNIPATIGGGSITHHQRSFSNPGDANGDGYINHSDRIAIAALSGATINSSANYDVLADVDLSGTIDADDVRALQVNTAAYRCAGDFNGDGLLNNSDYVDFINAYFGSNVLADIGQQGGVLGADGLFNNNDFVAYTDVYFAWYSGCH